MTTKIDEGEWVALVTRIEEAMAIHPFMPCQEDVMTLLSMAVNGNQHRLRVEDLTRLLAESEAKNDQWQKKLAEAWTEVEGVRGRNQRLQDRLDQILTLANLE